MFRSLLSHLTFLFTLNFVCTISSFSETNNSGNSVGHIWKRDVFDTSMNKDSDCKTYALPCGHRMERNVSWTVINSDLGHIKFSLSFFTCSYKIYSVTLLVLDDKDCKCNKIPSCTHSTKKVGSDSKLILLNDKIEYDVMFVFTSRYYFSITLVDENSTQIEYIFDEFINITTTYTKKLIGFRQPDVSPKYSAASQVFICTIRLKDDDLSLADKTEIQIQIHPDNQNYLSCIVYNNYNKSCDCLWTNGTLECRFPNVVPDVYFVYFEFYDLRCATSTLWVKNDMDCQWSFPFTAEPAPPLLLPPQDSRNHFLMFTLLTVVVIVIIISLLALIVCIYFKRYPLKIYHHYVSFAPLPRRQLCPTNKRKILLLYPRDCEAFMTAMQDFRCLLQDFFHSQVYDMWDDENWDKVNEVGHQWAMKYLTDKTTKVILVASPCSKLFEYALLDRKTIEYSQQPNCLDNIFLYSFKESVTLANYSLDNYKRFFVVRLEEPDCEENKFCSITPCTVYTIPQHLHDLKFHIHNINPSEICQNVEETSKINQLIHSIDELKKYKLNNSNYLNELLNVVDCQ